MSGGLLSRGGIFGGFLSSGLLSVHCIIEFSPSMQKHARVVQSFAI